MIPSTANCRATILCGHAERRVRLTVDGRFETVNFTLLLISVLLSVPVLVSDAVLVTINMLCYLWHNHTELRFFKA